MYKKFKNMKKICLKFHPSYTACYNFFFYFFLLQLNTKRAAKNLMLSEGTAWTDVSAMKTATQKLSGKAVMCQY